MDTSFVKIEHILHAEVEANGSSSLISNNTLWFSGRSTGVENVQFVSTWERLTWCFSPLFGFVKGLIIEINIWVKSWISMSTILLWSLVNQSRKLTGIFQFSAKRQSFINDRSILDDLLWLKSNRACYEKLWLAIIDSIGEFLWGKSTEHDGVNSSDSGACQHSPSSWGNHRHVDEDSVSFLDTELFFKHGGHCGDLFLHLSESVHFLNTSVRTIVVKSWLVAFTSIDMSINTVVANVHLTVRIPFVEVFVGGIDDLLWLLGPNQVFGFLGPKALFVID